MLLEHANVSPEGIRWRVVLYVLYVLYVWPQASDRIGLDIEHVCDAGISRISIIAGL